MPIPVLYVFYDLPVVSEDAKDDKRYMFKQMSRSPTLMCLGGTFLYYHRNNVFLILIG